MKTFGNKKEFAIGYELDNSKEAIFKVYVGNKSVCTFIKNNIAYEFRWNICELVEWLEINLDHILKEECFPLPVDGSTAIELYQNSGEFNSEDDIEFNNWHETRQDWIFRHSWYASRSGGYLADVYFRKVSDKIEISWDNCNLYDNIKFLNPKGQYYIEIVRFKDVINDFIKTFKLDIDSK